MSPSKPNSLADAWELFRSAVVLADTPVEAVDEMRIVFYAGAGALQALMFGRLDDESIDCTAEDEAFMMGINAELDAFAQAVSGGAA